MEYSKNTFPASFQLNGKEIFQAGRKAGLKSNFPRRFQRGWKKYIPFFWKRGGKVDFLLHPEVHLRVYLRV